MYPYQPSPLVFRGLGAYGDAPCDAQVGSDLDGGWPSGPLEMSRHSVIIPSLLELRAPGIAVLSWNPPFLQSSWFLLEESDI